MNGRCFHYTSPIDELRCGCEYGWEGADCTVPRCVSACGHEFNVHLVKDYLPANTPSLAALQPRDFIAAACVRTAPHPRLTHASTPAHRSPQQSPECENGGVCVRQGGESVCQCTGNWTGPESGCRMPGEILALGCTPGLELTLQLDLTVQLTALGSNGCARACALLSQARATLVQAPGACAW